MASRFQSLRGFNDILPSETSWWRRFQQTTQDVLDRYGYQEIKLPILEATELFARSVGETSDIVEKEMFTFLDREKNSITLRPEGTAGCVRAGIEHGLLHNQQQRLWYMGPMFRHERPQAGRYRQFNQLGVEAFGMTGVEIDVEVIAISARILRSLGLIDSIASPGIQLEINTLGSAESRASYRDALVSFLSKYEADLDEDSRRRLITNPLRVLDSKAVKTREILTSAPSLLGYLDDESRRQFEQLQKGLKALEIPYVINPQIVRGLDYYSHTVFEWTTKTLGAQGTVCAGGRYDGLSSQLGGGEVPAIGFAMGIERIVQLCKLAKIPAGFEEQISPQIYLCWMGEMACEHAMKLAETLRGDAFRVQLNVGGGSLKSQLKRADKSGARYALVLGDDETARNEVQVKSLRNDSQQITCGWPELSGRLAGLLGPLSPNT
jgi:histidyl-tRNA synthetase